MEIKVILKRHVKKENHELLTPLLIKLRNMALQQPGYILGQTLISIDNPDEYMVISSWKSLDEWNEWLANDERKAIQDEVDKILDHPTYYEVYCNG